VATLLFPPSLGELRAGARAEVVESWFAGHGENVRTEVAATYEDLEHRLVRAEVEMGWAPPHVCGEVAPRARAILKAVRGGHSTYRAALVARAEELPTLGRLRGLRAAWVDGRSTAGYLLPRAWLRSQGVDPDLVFEEQQFLGSFRDALLAVLAGRADVAAIHTTTPDEAGSRETMAECIGPQMSRLAPFAFTGETPSDGLVLTTKLAAAEAARLADRLLELCKRGVRSNLLLAVLGADALERAEPGDYGAIASGR
jgi:ABC-type phosphate/phosphonate transport system substrate-binding protein